MVFFSVYIGGVWSKFIGGIYIVFFLLFLIMAQRILLNFLGNLNEVDVI